MHDIAPRSAVVHGDVLDTALRLMQQKTSSPPHANHLRRFLGNDWDRSMQQTGDLIVSSPRPNHPGSVAILSKHSSLEKGQGNLRLSWARGGNAIARG
jgi:hypothetical protein